MEEKAIENKQIDTENKEIENPITRLTKKIISSDFFLVFGIDSYLKKLHDPFGEAYAQLKMAKDFNKETIIIIDSKLPQMRKIELDNYFHDMNIIGIIEIDWHDYVSINSALDQIDNILIKHGIK